MPPRVKCDAWLCLLTGARVQCSASYCWSDDWATCKEKEKMKDLFSSPIHTAFSHFNPFDSCPVQIRGSEAVPPALVRITQCSSRHLVGNELILTGTDCVNCIRLGWWPQMTTWKWNMSVQLTRLGGKQVKTEAEWLHSTRLDSEQVNTGNTSLK